MSGGVAAAVQGGASILGSIVGADAIGSAGTATRNEANAQQQLGLDLAKLTPEQLNNLNVQNQAAIQNLNDQQRVLSTVNPALMELGKQTLAMLRGDKSSGATGIFDQARAEQRTQLENQLKNQLGSGYATSSAGQAALNDFDRQTANGLYSAATSNIPTLAAIYGQGISSGLNNITNVNQQYAQNIGQKLGAFGTTSANRINAQAGGYAGQAAYGAAIGSAGGTLGSFFGGKSQPTSLGGAQAGPDTFSASSIV